MQFVMKDLLQAFIIKDNYLGVENYLNQGLDPDHRLDNSLSLYQYAIIHEAVEVATLLLEAGANPNIIFSTNKEFKQHN
jgi:ankyrin repeat protein